MLYETDLKVYDIQDFCVNTLKNSTDFETLCVAEVGSTLNFETDAVLNDYNMLPPLPYCTVHSGAESQDLRSEEWGHEYEVALVFGIADKTSETNPTPPSVVENGIKKYTSQRSIEKIAKQAIITIKKKMSETGIDGDYEIQLIAANGTKTATGEADDMNYILSLTFNYLNSIERGC